MRRILIIIVFMFIFSCKDEEKPGCIELNEAMLPPELHLLLPDSVKQYEKVYLIDTIDYWCKYKFQDYVLIENNSTTATISVINCVLDGIYIDGCTKKQYFSGFIRFKSKGEFDLYTFNNTIKENIFIKKIRVY